MRRILGVIICCFVLATGYIAYVIAVRQATLQKFARYNDSWSISQTVAEYMTLESRLAAYALGAKNVDYDEARLRLDIVLGRMDMLQQGTLRPFIDKDPERHALVAHVHDILNMLDERLESMKPDEIRDALDQLVPYDKKMTALASEFMESDIRLIDAAQAELQRLYMIYTALAAGLILGGVALVIMLLRHNDLLNKAHNRMQWLTDDLRAASSELQAQNNQLEHAAFHDALTGLPNRILFRQNLEKRLAMAGKKGPAAAILLLDLDGFKDVNDTLGHDVGDALLQAVAARLSTLIGRDDLICRLGGDEFAVLSGGVEESAALELANRIMQEINQPYRLDGSEIKIGTCVGVAISRDGSTADELFKQADLALYEAKALGAGRCAVFQSQMEVKWKEKKSLEADLQNALQNGEMELYYQPQADMDTRKICGYEALLRWAHPTRGMVSPADFIPVAEKTGLIHSIGDWVLRTACLEAARWRDGYRIAVNLSPMQFRSRTLIQNIIGALDAAGLDPSRLELEITESVLMDRSETTLATLRAMKHVGVHIAMDDFGTGYSSLGSLRNLPFDKIKIDQSFIQDITTRPEALSIVEFVIGIGRSLGMTTLAEGVETEEQYECLRRLGCDQAQGYLLGRPMPVERLVGLRRLAAVNH